MSVRLGPMPKQILESARNAGLATTLAGFGVKSTVEKPIGTELLGRVATKLRQAATNCNLQALGCGAEQAPRWKTFSPDLSPPVMSASPKSPPGDSSPSAAALSIFIRGKRHCRCGWNFSAIRSNHCASSTSILKLRCAIWVRLIFCSEQERRSPVRRRADREIEIGRAHV